jgi:hypothetical protein
MAASHEELSSMKLVVIVTEQSDDTLSQPTLRYGTNEEVALAKVL